MRTTIVIDDDIMNIARSIATSRGVSIGRVISELARRGIDTPPAYTVRSGLPVFSVREDAPVITTEMVKRVEDEAP